MDFLNDFLSWSFERHHNILSWYIRPLFLLPFCYFAYKRSIQGIIITLIALFTSMFWFSKTDNGKSKSRGLFGNGNGLFIWRLEG